jgi:hypothetical protein
VQNQPDTRSELERWSDQRFFDRIYRVSKVQHRLSAVGDALKATGAFLMLLGLLAFTLAIVVVVLIAVFS